MPRQEQLNFSSVCSRDLARCPDLPAVVVSDPRVDVSESRVLLAVAPEHSDGPSFAGLAFTAEVQDELQAPQSV